MDDLYSSSPHSDISIYSNDSISSHSKKKKKKKKNKHNYQDFIREETNIFEAFNNTNQYDREYDKISDLELKNDIQEKYLKYLGDINSPIIFAIGPAGTGKTFLACYYAIFSFMNEDINKIIITRPTVSVDEEHGFLPGSLNDKIIHG